MIFDPRRRADGAHRDSDRMATSLELPERAEVLAASELSPSQALAAECPVAIARLEQLDDAVFEAIAGRPQAFAAFQQLWPQVVRELHPDLVEESRVQYLRHAIEMWKHCVEGDELRNPQVAIATMDVIQMLLSPIER